MEITLNETLLIPSTYSWFYGPMGGGGYLGVKFPALTCPRLFAVCKPAWSTRTSAKLRMGPAILALEASSFSFFFWGARIPMLLRTMRPRGGKWRVRKRNRFVPCSVLLNSPRQMLPISLQNAKEKDSE